MPVIETTNGYTSSLVKTPHARQRLNERILPIPTSNDGKDRFLEQMASQSRVMDEKEEKHEALIRNQILKKGAYKQYREDGGGNVIAIEFDNEDQPIAVSVLDRKRVEEYVRVYRKNNHRMGRIEGIEKFSVYA
ncbi:MAG: hypothetical protein QGF74_03475 [Candidatus Nanoarchaeia archaeon]|jgi:hypothetical protein|nr:hypothetical protein [Candidatus Nanoarchaeia archaeon]|tara:strand:- start:44504 stop:44905 length:402 start_codon:yes stop_codon:yes gene_type:complete